MGCEASLTAAPMTIDLQPYRLSDRTAFFVGIVVALTICELIYLLVDRHV